MAFEFKSVETQRTPEGLTDISIKEISYSGSAETTPEAIETIDLDAVDISSGDSCSKEVFILFESSDGSTSIQSPMKYWAKLKNLPGVTLRAATVTALTTEPAAAGTDSSIATSTIKGRRDSGGDLAKSGSQSDRICLQLAVNQTAWGTREDYDPAKDGLTKAFTLGIYYENSEYTEWLDVAHGLEDIDFAELYEGELNFMLNVNGNEFECPVGHIEDGIEENKEVETLQKEMLNPKVVVMEVIKKVKYQMSFNLSVVDRYLFNTIINNQEIIYDSATGGFKVVGKDKGTPKYVELIYRGIDKGGRLWELDLYKVSMMRNGGITKHSENTTVPVVCTLMADPAQNNEVFSGWYSSKPIGITYIDGQFSVVSGN